MPYMYVCMMESPSRGAHQAPPPRPITPNNPTTPPSSPVRVEAVPAGQVRKAPARVDVLRLLRAETLLQPDVRRPISSSSSRPPATTLPPESSSAVDGLLPPADLLEAHGAARVAVALAAAPGAAPLRRAAAGAALLGGIPTTDPHVLHDRGGSGLRVSTPLPLARAYHAQGFQEETRRGVAGGGGGEGHRQVTGRVFCRTSTGCVQHNERESRLFNHQGNT